MTFSFILQQRVTLPELEQLTGMTVSEEKTELRQIKVLDSVDWAIWLSGQVFIASDNNRLELIAADNSCKASAVVGRGRSNARLFAHELPDPLAAELKQLISVRALILKFSCQWRELSLAFLNKDDKIVARATIFHVDDATAESPAFLQLRPLRGYDRQAQFLTRSLNPIATATAADITIRFLLKQCGLALSPPVTRPEFHLDAQQPTEAAILAMVAELLRRANREEEGLIADIDSEFAHQYRVNLRKARSLLSLFKRALAPERYRELRQELRKMAQATNRLRDLDVFLLAEDDYRAMLPKQFQPGLDSLFKRLRRRRQSTWRNVAETLAEEAYGEKIIRLEKLLKNPPDFSTRRSRNPIKKQVSRNILAQYRAMQRDGRRIDAATPDEQIHKLRIEAKKLRYLLELFAELFPRDLVRQLIKALKRLQDNLGRFNDYSSQCFFLAQLMRTPGTTAAERDAINGLIAVLFGKQQSERERLVGLIAEFTGPRIAEQFNKLIAPSAAKDRG